jgi:excinuclease ABC subunit A
LSPILLSSTLPISTQINYYIKEGFERAYVNNKYILLSDIESQINLSSINTFDCVVDRIILKGDGERGRLFESVELALKLSKGICDVLVNEETRLHFNDKYDQVDDNLEVPNLEPNLFSFNTPNGCCPYCNGLGLKQQISLTKLINEEKPPLEGGLIPYDNNEENNLQSQMIRDAAKHFKIDLSKKMKDLTKNERDILLYGSNESVKYHLTSNGGLTHVKESLHEGIVTNLERRYMETQSEWIRDWIYKYMEESTCPHCHGQRLNRAALSIKINNKNIAEVQELSIEKALLYINNLQLTETELLISKLIINELNSRLSFLFEVGLGYLTLDRSAATLSGGEAQRIRLATQIGSKLSGILYVLDEPSIGLHQRDNIKLIEALKKMRDLDNTLIVVEHDHETILSADYVIDIGPLAGIDGGQLVFSGTPKELLESNDSLTAKYLNGSLSIKYNPERRKYSDFISIENANLNNLKNINVKIPTHVFTCITGVSGSGKSTLVNEILLTNISNQLKKNNDKPLVGCKKIDYKDIKKIIEISQHPIGRTPRSNPATYTGVFDFIRDLFASTNESKIRGYTKSRFSFNIKGGRCEACGGDGVRRISMNFMPDVFVPCEICKGKKYNSETLQIKFKGKNIFDVLDMTVSEAALFFKDIHSINKYMEILCDVGLGYIKLGQSATTLSGGEAQRIKLASELFNSIDKNTLYILDEPTTGLHTHDVNNLVQILNRIADNGATLVVIEHNLDLIKCADYIIDLGPEGGDLGGKVIATGTPNEVANIKTSYTGQYLKELLK